MTTPITAFVAGATGYTGRRVVEALRARGARVVAHLRPGSSDAAGWRERWGALGAEVSEVPWSDDAMRAELARLRPDHVFALLGTTRRRAAAEGLASPYERIDYGLTAMLRAAAEACGSAPRFHYLSAIGATESTRNPYVRVRGRMERELRAGTLPWLIARPAFVSGPDRAEFRLAERLGAVVSDAVLDGLAAIGLRGPRERWGSLTGRELGAAMAQLALVSRDGRAVADVAALRAAARAYDEGALQLARGTADPGPR